MKLIERLKASWNEPRDRMAACGERVGVLLDSLERSGHLNTVTGRRPKVVIRLVRELTKIEQELLR